MFINLTDSLEENTMKTLTMNYTCTDDVTGTLYLECVEVVEESVLTELLLKWNADDEGYTYTVSAEDAALNAKVIADEIHVEPIIYLSSIESRDVDDFEVAA